MPPKKDPNKPKGRMSAYAFFVQEKRSEYREKGQDVDFTAFSRECAERWKGEKTDKKKYQKLADIDKERHARQMEDYVPPEGVTKKKSAKKQKDPNMPKRAMSAFFLFAADKRPKLKEQTPGATVGEIAKQLGAAWKVMRAEHKKPYEADAEKGRVKYAEDMVAYRKGDRKASAKKAAVTVQEDDDDEEEYSEED